MNLKLQENQINMQYMTPREKAMRDKIIALLKNDGHGRRYPKYAERLKDFVFKIIPLEEANRQGLTAGMNAEEGVIIINEGFLLDEKTFNQLSVLMRHELAHALMMHQIRMTNKLATKYDADGAFEMSLSNSIHYLENIIGDLEISHSGRYTEADKETVRNIVLNGKIIGGLLTEDLRPSWVNLSLEDLYDQLESEVKRSRQSLQYKLSYEARPNDVIEHAIMDAMSKYSDIASWSGLRMPIKDFMQSELFKKMPASIQGTFKAVFTECGGWTEDAIMALMLDIKNSSPLEPFTITSKSTGEIVAILRSPEAKGLIIDLLKVLVKNTTWDHEEDFWFKQISNILDSLRYKYSPKEKADFKREVLAEL